MALYVLFMCPHLIRLNKTRVQIQSIPLFLLIIKCNIEAYKLREPKTK
jgi:hypothetical protein